MKLLFLLLCLGSITAAEDSEWKPLFNGKDFNGWETYLAEPPPEVEVPGLTRTPTGVYTQVIGVNRDPFGAFSYVTLDGQTVVRISGDILGGIATTQTYSNFHLRLEFKWGALRPYQRPGQLRNSGVLYHGHGQHGEGNKRWLPSQQFQLQNGFIGDYVAMGDGVAIIPGKRVFGKRLVYDPQSSEITFSNKSPNLPRCGKRGREEKPEDEWNLVELYCVGDEAIHVVNGEVVLRAKSRMRASDNSLVPLDQGRLELQAETWEIFFRNVKIRSISKIPAELSE